MPTPLGHLLSGLAVAWSVEALAVDHKAARSQHPPSTRWRDVALLAALAAILPDVDLLLGGHRGWTHSVGAALMVSALAALWARRESLPVAATATAVGLACASHALLDWLGTDGSMPRGVMVFWPFDSRHHFSPVAIFPRVERRYWLGWEFVRAGLVAVAFEIIVLGTVAYAAWRWRVRRARGIDCAAPADQ